MKQVRALKILFLAANPEDTDRLRLDEEIRSIDEALRKAEFRDQYEIVQHWAVRVADLQECLLRHQPNIVHFSGHGSKSEGIILEDKDGGSHPVFTRALSRVFDLLRDNIRCVVLNACYSAEQASVIAEHVDCVVGMSKAVGDEASIAFATAFYQALGYGRDVKTAFDLGCSQIDLKGLDEQDTPQLKTRRGIDPQKIVFVTSWEAEAIRDSQELLQVYRDHLTHRVSTVRIFGEAEPRPLEKIFVELNLVEEYERPTIHTQWLGLMDAELRRRRDIFARDDKNKEATAPEMRLGKDKRTFKPEELLRQRMQAVIVGAPGCGKTTLLRYLAVKTIKEEKRFPVFLELKSVSEKAFETADGNLAALLFDKAVAGLLDLSQVERENFRNFFFARLKAGEVAIFLDGLDEVAGAKFFQALCRALNEWARSVYRQSELIVSTRPYALQTRFEGLKEIEIAPLNPWQIDEFLKHYYGEYLLVNQLRQQLRRRRELRDLARVPFLLGVISQLYWQQREIIGERLELYREIVQQLVNQLDREKQIQRFELKDPEGDLKRRFLKQLAYERLFVDEVDKDAERLIFTRDIILQKAEVFCQTKRVDNPHLLAADVKATPLLREIGADAYAFAHLTLHEYLAAVALLERQDAEAVFCRAVFNPTLAEMEVLPMALGLRRQPNDFYPALEQLPESLTFTNLRLRARSLVYNPNIHDKYFLNLTEWLNDFITKHKIEESPYWDAIFRSFSGPSGQSLDLIVDCVGALLQNADWFVRRAAAFVLGKIGGERAVDTLLAALKDEDSFVHEIAAMALAMIGDEQAVNGLVVALENGESEVRELAANALKMIGDERAVNVLTAALKNEDNLVRFSAAWALREIGDLRALEGLLIALRDDDNFVREMAAEALDEISGETARAILLTALKDKDSEVREYAIERLGEIGGDIAVDGILNALKDYNSNVRERAAAALGMIGDQRAVDGLVDALKDEDKRVREHATAALGMIGDKRAVDGLVDAFLRDEEKEVRERAIAALKVIDYRYKQMIDFWRYKEMIDHEQEEEIGYEYGEEIEDGYELDIDYASEKKEGLLTAVLKNADSIVRESVVEALGMINHEQALYYLLATVKDKTKSLREHTDSALEMIEYDESRLVYIDSSYAIRAAEALREIGDDSAVNRVLAALKHEDSIMRERAVEVLGKIGGERAINGLLVALQDKDKYVRESSAEALEKIGAQTLANGLVQALFHRNSFVRCKAAQVVGYYTTDKQVLATLHNLVTTDLAEEVRAAAREAAERYANKLRYFAE